MSVDQNIRMKYPCRKTLLINANFLQGPFYQPLPS